MKKNIHEFLCKNMEMAANDFNMIQPGDRMMVGISGGADCFVLLKSLSGRKIFIPQDIEIIATHIDLGFFDDDTEHIDRMKAYFESEGYEYHIENPCPSSKISKRLYIKKLLQDMERKHKTQGDKGKYF